MRENKNLGGLICLRIATSHQCVTALTNTQRGVRASIPFQGRVTDWGFSLLPPCCWKPSRELLLLEEYRELLCPAGIQFISQFQLILSDCAMAFYLLCPSVPIYRNTPAPQLGGSDIQPIQRHLWWERRWCRVLLSQWLTPGQNSTLGQLLFSGTLTANSSLNQSQAPEANPAPASWRGPGYFKASPTGLMQCGCSHTVGSQLSHGTCGCCGDALAANLGSNPPRACPHSFTASVHTKRVCLKCPCCVYGCAFALKQTRSIPAVELSCGEIKAVLH